MSAVKAFRMVSAETGADGPGLCGVGMLAGFGIGNSVANSVAHGLSDTTTWVTGVTLAAGRPGRTGRHETDRHGCHLHRAFTALAYLLAGLIVLVDHASAILTPWRSASKARLPGQPRQAGSPVHW